MYKKSGSMIQVRYFTKYFTCYTNQASYIMH